MKRVACLFVGIVLLFSSWSPGGSASVDGERILVLVRDNNDNDVDEFLSSRGGLYWKGDDFLIGALTPAGVSEMIDRGFSTFPLEGGSSGQQLYIVTPAPDVSDEVIGSLVSGNALLPLYNDDDMGIVRAVDDAVGELLQSGHRVIRVREKPLPVNVQGFPYVTGDAGYDPRHDPVQALVDQVSETALESNVQRLQDFRSRYVQSDSIWAASQWIYDQFIGYGYGDVAFDTLTVLVFGRQHWNVLATKPGVGDPSRIVMLGAHYDSFAFPNPSGNAPGADDNGSGVSAVLEVARILADVDLDATVIFAAWTAEEVGLVGSGDFVDRANQSGLDIELYMNVDACGYLGDPARDVDLLSDEPSRPYSELMLAMAERYTTLVPTIEPNIDFSDHTSFRQYGYAFTYSLEGEITPYIHTPQDLVGTIDFSYMREIVQINIATLVDVAGLSDHGLFVFLDPVQQNVLPGDTLEFDTWIVNNSGSPVSGDLWFEVVTEDSVEILVPDRLLNLPSNPLPGALADGQDFTLGVELYVPQNLNPGAFLLFGRIGNYGGVLIDEDSFLVTVGSN